MVVIMLLAAFLAACSGNSGKRTVKAEQIDDDAIEVSVVNEWQNNFLHFIDDSIQWKPFTSVKLVDKPVVVVYKLKLNYTSSKIIDFEGANKVELFEQKGIQLVKHRNAGILAEDQRLFMYQMRACVIIETATQQSNYAYAQVSYTSLKQKPRVLMYSTPGVYHRLNAKILMDGFLLGALLVILIINFIFWLSTKDKTYRPYIFYVLGFALFFAIRETFIFETISHLLSPLILELVMILASVIIITSYLWFVRSYLKLGIREGVWNIIISILIAASVFLFVILGVLHCLGTEPSTLIVALWAVFIFTLMNVPVWRQRNAYKPARLLLLSNVILSIGALINVLIGIDTHSILINNALEIAVVGQMILFSKGIGERLSLEIQEKEQAQEKALKLLEQKVTERTVELVAQKELVEKKNKAILDSLNYARHIQAGILPSSALLDELLGENFVLYKPKSIVAGDFYWLEQVGDKVFFAVADCTGHGVPGALVSVMCSNILTRLVKEFKLSQPAEILDNAVVLLENYFEKSDHEVKDGMDLALCCYQSSTGILEYAGANNPLYLVRSNTLEEYKADRQPIGKYRKRKTFTNHSIQLQKADCLYMSSDGYADQFGGPDGAKFRYNRFKELLINSHNLKMIEQKGILDKTIEDWKAGCEQIDDICVMGLRIK